ncbi:hypothetical protein H9P43_006082 [Blastocladiella emersonii ATCC 22665]|nr:hypothetical protein H9P43_006082 [Blastocladiella emersonii ATCC 22665]
MHPIINLPHLIETVLCHAVRLHADASDLSGLMQHARVAFRADIPRVTRTILCTCPLLAIDEASKRGNVAVLDLWREMKLPLRYMANALLGAGRGLKYAALDWWRDAGLPLPPMTGEVDEEETGKAFEVVAGVVGARAVAEMKDKQPLPENLVEPGDARALRMAHSHTMGVYAGRLTAAGITALNAVLAESPPASGSYSFTSEKANNLTFGPCNMTADLARSLQLPPSLKRLAFTCMRHDVPRGALPAEAGAPFPDSLTSLTFCRSWIDPRCAAALGSLFPRKLESLRCGLTSADLAALGPVIPDSLMNLRLPGNTAVAAGAMPALAPYLHEGLTALDLTFCALNDGDLACLAPHLAAGLRSFKLFNSEPGDASDDDAPGRRALVTAVAGLKRLDYLWLGALGITDEEVRVLLAGVSKNIEVLVLDGNPVSDASVDAILRFVRGMASGKLSVSVAGTEMSESGVREIEGYGSKVVVLDDWTRAPAY